MKKNIEELVNIALEDNKEYIAESGCDTVAEYLKSSLNQESDYTFYFNNEEIEFGVSDEQEKVVENWIDENYGDMKIINKEELIDSLDFTEDEYNSKEASNSFDEFIDNILDSCRENKGSLEDATFIANDAFDKLEEAESNANKFEAIPDKETLTYTICVDGNKYITNSFNKEEFEEKEYFTESDWRNFLRTEDFYYTVR